jgi:hypothetical protein
MSSIYFDPAFSYTERRLKLYSGDIIILSATLGTKGNGVPRSGQVPRCASRATRVSSQNLNRRWSHSACATARRQAASSYSPGHSCMRLCRTQRIPHAIALISGQFIRRCPGEARGTELGRDLHGYNYARLSLCGKLGAVTGGCGPSIGALFSVTAS